jgi:molybdopterin biosynthesis enzyme
MKSEMKPIKETIPLEEARQLIADACKQIDRSERVRLVDANGRVAAADVESTRDASRCAPRIRSAPIATTRRAFA